mmetsp:Transcript_10151/g.21802  ORF Transcript_10151/g.21802 Transcript_10151/m.21802 type:complete len:111 (-) Transcript_10151:46-378(-)
MGKGKSCLQCRPYYVGQYCRKVSCRQRISSSVPASMKQDIYNTEAVLTDSSLVCSSCDCKCGAKQTDDKRNLCVHVLVVPFLLTVLLVEDLAEHFLVEITGMMPNLLAKS